MPFRSPGDPSLAVVFQVFGNALGSGPSKIAVDNVKREIDPCRQPAGRGDFVVLDKSSLAPLHQWELLLKRINRFVVGGGSLSVQQPGQGKVSHADNTRTVRWRCGLEGVVGDTVIGPTESISVVPFEMAHATRPTREEP